MAPPEADDDGGMSLAVGILLIFLITIFISCIAAVLHHLYLKSVYLQYDRIAQENRQGDREADQGAGPGHLGRSARRQPPLLRRHDRWAIAESVRGWAVQARTFLARRLPHDAAQGTVPHQDLPPQHRSAGQDLPGRVEEQLESSASDSNNTPQHSSITGRPQPRRSTGQRRSPGVEGEPSASDQHGEGVDRSVCCPGHESGLLNAHASCVFVQLHDIHPEDPDPYQYYNDRADDERTERMGRTLDID